MVTTVTMVTAAILLACVAGQSCSGKPKLILMNSGRGERL